MDILNNPSPVEIILKYMNKIICQKDEVCAGCGNELPRGSWAYLNSFDDLFCEECEEIEKD